MTPIERQEERLRLVDDMLLSVLHAEYDDDRVLDAVSIWRRGRQKTIIEFGSGAQSSSTLGTPVPAKSKEAPVQEDPRILENKGVSTTAHRFHHTDTKQMTADTTDDNLDLSSAAALRLLGSFQEAITIMVDQMEADGCSQQAIGAAISSVGIHAAALCVASVSLAHQSPKDFCRQAVALATQQIFKHANTLIDSGIESGIGATRQ